MHEPRKSDPPPQFDADASEGEPYPRHGGALSDEQSEWRGTRPSEGAVELAVKPPAAVIAKPMAIELDDLIY